jgi:hypothetical protein
MDVWITEERAGASLALVEEYRMKPHRSSPLENTFLDLFDRRHPKAFVPVINRDPPSADVALRK